ncbi:MAG TPA: hypothetical protein QGF63_07065 [Alphaproteobacteria bacterium]|jgi:hypothetical protein|nr:hypothetical protein [Alphaproteobacteria bacterium]|tara:strand:+ start:47 stop:403 length:357 start_codon:yes stop_codon:yes gene_type:complete
MQGATDNALCMKCGNFKENAFRECAKCEFVPQSEHEFAYSLGLTQYFLGKQRFEEFAEAIKSGNAPIFDSAAWKRLIGSVRESNVRQIMGIAEAESEADHEQKESRSLLRLFLSGGQE